MLNLNEAVKINAVAYGGNAGAKYGVKLNGGIWMIKYPKTTRDMANPQISYTTSPLSEYLGSKIYETFKIPVHETKLGIRNGKVVVACKDFTRTDSIIPIGILILFHELKNSFMAGDLDSYSGTGSETLLGEVLDTIKGLPELTEIGGVINRFWDMFVIDAFIGNNDRNNGNWGILAEPGGVLSLAPVFDNGNAFFNKKSSANMEKRMKDETAIREDALEGTCIYKYTGTDTEGKKIKPFEFIKKGDNPDCNAAVSRFLQSVDMNSIKEVINSVPETFNEFLIMPQVQKNYYLKLLHLRLKFLQER